MSNNHSELLNFYQDFVDSRAAKLDTGEIVTAVEFRPFNPVLLHAAMGCVTEAGEFMDAMKRQMIYGKDLDHTNVIEELGDLMFYVAMACNDLGVPIEHVVEKNMQKLRQRYPDKFTSERALNRDLGAERQVLEGSPVKRCDCGCGEEVTNPLGIPSH